MDFRWKFETYWSHFGMVLRWFWGGFWDISKLHFIPQRHRSERRSVLNTHVLTYKQLHTDMPTCIWKSTRVHTHLYASICKHMHRDTNTCKEKLQVLTRSFNWHALPVHLLRQVYLGVFFWVFLGLVFSRKLRGPRDASLGVLRASGGQLGRFWGPTWPPKGSQNRGFWWLKLDLMLNKQKTVNFWFSH